MNSVEQDVHDKPAQSEQAQDEKPNRVFRQTALLTLLSIISPTLGLMSEAALAWRFGASGVVDAYRITVLLLLYGQQLFVTAILPFVLVPIFAECRSRGREEDAWAVADSVAQMLLVFGTVISAFSFFRPDLAIALIAPGLAGESRSLAIFFMKWCGLGFLPICWTGAACGILYAHDVIQVGAVSQLLSNLVMVLAIIIGGGRLGPNSLILGVLGGAFVSACIYTYKVRGVRRRFGPACRAPVRLESLTRAFKLAGPLILAMLVMQGTSIVINRVLSRLPVGSLASFGYALKMGILVQLAPNAMTTVLFPKFSDSWFSKDRDAFGPLCANAIRAALFIAIPLTCICHAAQSAIVTVLLGRGAFNSANISTASALFGLMIIGAPASTVAVSLSRAFYAAQQPRFPVMVDTSSNLCELAFIPALASRFGLNGVASAYMLLPWMTSSGLLGLFIHRNRSFPTLKFLWSTVKIVLTAMVCAWLAGMAGHLMSDPIEAPFVRSLVMIAVTGILALAGYLSGTLMLGLPEAVSLQQLAQKMGRKLVTMPGTA